MPITIHRIESRLLLQNPLQDPSTRDLYIYTPPGFDPSRKYPTLLGLAGFSGNGAGLFNNDPFSENLAQRLDRLITAKECPPLLVVAPDCFTRVGGNQYLNSPSVGPYEDYLLREIMPWVEANYPVLRWGVFGKSSGGYGAITLAMKHPDRFAAVADHSGDAGFELCYIPDLVGALDAFTSAGGPAKWLERFWQDVNKRRRQYMKPLNILAMAAFYAPNPEAPMGAELPVDQETGAFLPHVWEHWRAKDPIHMAETLGENLKKLRLVYIDVGTKDEFGLLWGNRALVAKLRAKGVNVHYEEFSDGHMNVHYRHDSSMPLLGKALLGE